MGPSFPGVSGASCTCVGTSVESIVLFFTKVSVLKAMIVAYTCNPFERNGFAFLSKGCLRSCEEMSTAQVISVLKEISLVTVVRLFLPDMKFSVIL